MKKLLAAVLAASMCLSYATFVGAAGQSSRGMAREGTPQYEVKFSADGEGGTVSAAYDSGDSRVTDATSPITVDSGVTVTFTAEPEEGHEVDTWNVDENEGLKVSPDKGSATLKITKVADVKVTFKAKEGPVDPDEYTVTFNGNGGTPAMADKTTVDGKVTKPNDPTWEGYTFNGWFTSATGDTSVNFDEAITENVTFYAQWTKNASGKPSITDVRFTEWDTLKEGDDNVKAGATVIEMRAIGGTPPFTYSIKGNSAGRFKVVDDKVNVGATALTAGTYEFDVVVSDANEKTFEKAAKIVVSKADAKQVTITFDGNGGNIIGQSVVETIEGAKMPNPEAINPGFKFIGWSETKDGKTVDFNDLLVTNDVTYYAIWAELPKAEVAVDPDVEKETGIKADKVIVTGDSIEADQKLDLGKSTKAPTKPDKFFEDHKDNISGIKPVAGKESVVIDIKLLDKNNAEVQPDGTVAITLPVPNALKGAKMILVIHYIDENNTQFGSWEVFGDEFTFETNGFSTFEFMAVELTETTDPDEPINPDKPSGGGSSGGGGGGGGGGSVISGGGLSGSGSGSATVSTGTATKEATKAVENAVKAAANAGAKSTNAAVTFKNVKAMTPDAFKAINSAAAKASKGVAVKTSVQMDTVVNGKLEARMYIDPTLAAGLKTSIKTTVDVSPKSKENAKTASVVSKYFNNTAAVINFAQQGSFGMNVSAAVKIDTSKMNTKTLVFYSYNAKTNKFTAIAAPAYFVDSAGYLHFTTPVGGSIVITDKPLESK